MKRLTSDESKVRILNLLIKFANYCDANGLKYYMLGGTLLGAVRHKGFIPWDDDIDVCMPRPDYEKFIALQNRDKTIEIRCVENKTSDFPFLKLVDEKTLVRQPYVTESETSSLWVDVFPFDGWADDEKQAEKDMKIRNGLEWLMIYAHTKAGDGTTTARKILKLPMVFMARMIGGKNIAKKMDKLAQKYDYESSAWIGNFVWACYRMRERLPREWFEQRVKLPFEGYEFWAPKEWDKYLTQIYGDYMTPPPVDKRVNHNMEVWLK
ncbi:LicD family protein [Faecalibacterium duncaniae]|uniref:LicD family protein n=1 Tax=Faecalibacterium duncaniae (strain DSM 17677 / JCM 31915 / A2-165) TaxID=411483 RepID=UPI003ED8D34D